MEQQYLIDNNVIANFFQDNFSKSAMEFVAGVIDDIPNISVITEIEALSWHSKDSKKEESVKDFIGLANILLLDKQIVAKCIEIRRAKRIKTPDAIIAATAIIRNLILLTSDSDFSNIDGLRMLNPSTL
jgi:predicted nucleic acid-binding protein